MVIKLLVKPQHTSLKLPCDFHAIYSMLAGLKWPQIVSGNHLGWVMTVCVNLIKPFLAGTKAALAENVITFHHRRCDVG